MPFPLSNRQQVPVPVRAQGAQPQGVGGRHAPRRGAALGGGRNAGGKSEPQSGYTPVLPPFGGSDICILRASANDFAKQSLVSTLLKSGALWSIAQNRYN